MGHKKGRTNIALGLVLLLATVAISCNTGDERTDRPPCPPYQFTEKEASQAYQQKIDRVNGEIKAIETERKPCRDRAVKLIREIRRIEKTIKRKTEQLALLSMKKRTKKNLRKLYAIAKELHHDQSELKRLEAARKADRNDEACWKIFKALRQKREERRSLKENREKWIFDYRLGKIK